MSKLLDSLACLLPCPEKMEWDSVGTTNIVALHLCKSCGTGVDEKPEEGTFAGVKDQDDKNVVYKEGGRAGSGEGDFGSSHVHMPGPNGWMANFEGL